MQETVGHPFEIEYVSTRKICCDGGTLGHPAVYLQVPELGMVDCPYCSRRFIHRPSLAE
ncbi:MAG: zinc-finger domain-containing protein [Pseudomonadota bacterium]